jgi:proteasome assembly chaperone (PAC2) family protein
MLAPMPLYRLHDHPDLIAPSLVAAFDGWVDAGGAASSAVGALIEDATLVASFDPDQLFDYRSRRPTLEIVDGRLAELTWPELTIRQARLGERDILVLSGHEPDDRWRTLCDAMVEIAGRLGVAEWVSLGAIPAAVPHTRPVNVLGTATRPDLIRGGVEVGPAGVMHVPAAALSALEMAIAAAGIPAVGYFAQVPHYVSGAYPAAAVELLRALGRHLDVEPPMGSLPDEARQLRLRLDAATALDETSRTYVERLEGMVDEARLPSGDDLISEIERFLHDRGSEGSQRS